jgi:hypothetical protein
LFVEQEKDSVNHPEFRNWFYIYKNFSVEPDFKVILQQNYLTEVKDVDRLDRDDAESVGVTESPQISVDAPVQEENINEMTTNRQEGDDSMAPVKLEDSVLPEEVKETTVPAEGDRVPEKEENPTTSSEQEEIMQVSGDDVITKSDKVGPLKIVFPIPFPEKLQLRKLYDEREAGPSGAVMTMQEEMFGKDEEKADEKKNEEKIEGTKDDMINAEKKDEMKEKGSKNEDKEISSDKKEGNIQEMKDGITSDRIKEDENMKEQERDHKCEGMKNDNTGLNKEDKIEATKEDAKKKVIGDEMGPIKDGIMEETKDDTMKDEKMDAMKDKMEETKEDQMEAMKDDKTEAIRGDKTEVMKGEMVTDENKENDKTNEMSEGFKNEMIKDESKKEEVVTEEKDNESEVTIVDDKKVAPITEQKEAILVADRKTKHFGLPRLSQGSLHLHDVTTSLSSNNIVRKDSESEFAFK